MNFVPVHGLSSSAYAVTYGPDMPGERVADFYHGYRISTLDRELTPRKAFTAAVRAGRLVNSVIWQDGIQKAIWGCQLHQDGSVRYLSILYIAGELPAPVLVKVAEQTKKIARAVGTNRVWIAGRKGWRRKLSRIGMEVDELGFVIDAAAE